MFQYNMPDFMSNSEVKPAVRGFLEGIAESLMIDKNCIFPCFCIVLGSSIDLFRKGFE